MLSSQLVVNMITGLLLGKVKFCYCMCSAILLMFRLPLRLRGVEGFELCPLAVGAFPGSLDGI